MNCRHLTPIAVESVLLALVLSGLAATAVPFQHAAVGLPLIASGSPSSAYAVTTPSYARRSDELSDRPNIAITPGALPSHVILDVPFTPQAPFGDWRNPYGEACEEASVAMVMTWAAGETLTPEKANAAILNQVAYEDFYFGYNHDTALRETAKLLTRHYGYQGAAVAYDVTADDIRRALAGGNAVLLPVAGRLLYNPYYLGPPPYHMVVVRGYDDVAQEFIVNDPGTRRGESFRYSYTRLWEAIHDWTGSDNTILSGRKGMIVVRPPRGA